MIQLNKWATDKTFLPIHGQIVIHFLVQFSLLTCNSCIAPPIACEQALLSRWAKRAPRERASEGPRNPKGVLGPSRPHHSFVRSRETRFARPKRRACSQVTAPTHSLTHEELRLGNKFTAWVPRKRYFAPINSVNSEEKHINPLLSACVLAFI